MIVPTLERGNNRFPFPRISIAGTARSYSPWLGEWVGAGHARETVVLRGFSGAGGESRQPLGLAVVGGLLFSQSLTLYVTPVFYLYMEDLQAWLRRCRKSP